MRQARVVWTAKGVACRALQRRGAGSAGGRDEAEAFLRPYGQELAELGHWSMRAKTQVLERLEVALDEHPCCGRATLVGALWLAAGAGHPRIAGELFRMLEDGQMVMRGDPSPFDALLKAEAVAAEPDALRIHEAWAVMRRHGVRPAKRSYELLCVALYRAGEETAAAAVQEQAEGEGITFDYRPEGAGAPPAAASPASACLAVLAVAASKGDVASAERAVQELWERYAEVPTAHHYQHLLHVYAASRAHALPKTPLPTAFLAPPYTHPDPGRPDPQGILGVWARAEAMGHPPTPWWYDHVLAACVAARCAPLAEAAFTRAHAAGCAREQHLWARLMQVYAACGRDDAAQELLRRMWEEGHAVKRDSRVMRAFVDATSQWLSAGRALP
eukprot:TRINITY_DN4928_c0_g1_i1.p1 TRINITY_DN4928_c0_g1~~TRINITY_DN4928_c0_g1_i1.p1  ORF type:complete len:388 (+),score=71.84 TRINITY_DN4928_c0_g1_i1:152-1315(+)